MFEHQRQQKQEQESVKSAPPKVHRRDLSLPPQYANSSDDALLKTMKPGKKIAFKTGLTMDEESLKRSLARLDFQVSPCEAAKCLTMHYP